MCATPRIPGRSSLEPAWYQTCTVTAEAGRRARQVARRIAREGYVVLAPDLAAARSAFLERTPTFVEETFLGRYLRHIPVKKDDRVIGMASIGDVLRELARNGDDADQGRILRQGLLQIVDVVNEAVADRRPDHVRVDVEGGRDLHVRAPPHAVRQQGPAEVAALSHTLSCASTLLTT